MNEEIVIDTARAVWFTDSKLFGFYLPASLEIGKKYFFNNVPEIDKKRITGIDAYSYDVLNPNYPQTVSLGGKVYNTIAVGDVYKVLCVFADADGNTKLKLPLSALSRFATINNTPRLEVPRYDLRIHSGKSFFQFVELPLVTASPVFIPFNFHFD